MAGTHKFVSETHSNIESNVALPLSRFIFRENGEFVEKTTRDLFYNKRVVLFGLPGAFTPTCTTSQVPDFEEAYDELIAAGVDEVYCISVNDAFVMNAWRESLGVEKVKFIPDGNGFFTRLLGNNVHKTNVGFGMRSWRYACVINDDRVEVIFNEIGKEDNCTSDPYEVANPNTILEYLKQCPRTNSDDYEDNEDIVALNQLEDELFLKKN